MRPICSSVGLGEDHGHRGARHQRLREEVARDQRHQVSPPSKTVGITGSPRDICWAAGGSSARAARVPLAGGVERLAADDLAVADQRRPAAAGRRRRSSAGSPMPITSASATPSRGRAGAARTCGRRPRSCPCSSWPPTDHRAVVALAGDQLVDEAAGRVAAAGDQLGADAVAVDRRRRPARRSRTRRGRWSRRSGSRSRRARRAARAPGGRARPGRRSRGGPRRAPGRRPRRRAAPPRRCRRCRPAAWCPRRARATWARNASLLGVVQQREASGRWCRRVGTPYRCRAARLEVAAKPATYAARAAATAASSWVRREPISMHGPVTGGQRHPRGGRGDRRVVVVDREQHRLEHAPPRRSVRLDDQQRGVAGSRSRPRRSPRCRRRSGSRPASPASRSSTTPSRSDRERLVVEAERLDRVERPADAGDHAVPPPLGQPPAGTARRPTAGARCRGRSAACSMVSS